MFDFHLARVRGSPNCTLSCDNILVSVTVSKGSNKFARWLGLFWQSRAWFGETGKLLPRRCAADKPYNRLSALGDDDVFTGLGQCYESAQLGPGVCQRKGLHANLMIVMPPAR